MPGYDPEGPETYPAREDGVDSIGNALAAAKVLAILAAVNELKRMNDGRDQFHREVLEVLTRSTEGRSAPGASAQGVEEGGTG